MALPQVFYTVVIVTGGEVDAYIEAGIGVAGLTEARAIAALAKANGFNPKITSKKAD